LIEIQKGEISQVYLIHKILRYVKLMWN